MMTILMMTRAIVVVLLVGQLGKLIMQVLRELYAPELRTMAAKHAQAANHCAVQLEVPQRPAPRPAQIPDIRIPA